LGAEAVLDLLNVSGDAAEKKKRKQNLNRNTKKKIPVVGPRMGR
jgi:hypothetical protein